MKTRIAIVVAWAALAVVAGPAWGQCPPSPGPLGLALPSARAAASRYTERYDALLAKDPYLFTGSEAAGWRALSADLAKDTAVPAELKAWTLIMLAASLQKDENVEEGLAAARAALEIAQAAGLDGTPLHAEIMTTLADKEAIAGKSADAVGHADKAIAEMSKHYGEHSWAYGRAMMSATMAYNGFGRYEDTERFAAKAEASALACLPVANPFVGQTITGHSAVLGTMGQIDDSLREAERALAWTNRYVGEDDKAVAYLLDSYGWTLRNAGRLREAEAVLRRSVDLFARYHHDAWSDRASATGKFANVLAAEGRYLEAEAMWLKTREYYRAAHDLSNPLGGSGELRRSADAAELRGDLPLALSRRVDAVELIESHAQPGHPELARARLEYAATLSLMGRTQEAMRVAEPAIAGVRSAMARGDFKRLGAEILYARIAGKADAPAAYAAAAPVAAQMESALLDATTSRGNLVLFAPAFSASFGTVTELALETGHQDDAFRDLQLANLSEIALVNADTATRAAAVNPQSRLLIERLQDRTRQRRQLDRDRTYAASRNDAVELDRVQDAIKSNDKDIAECITGLDRSFPAFRSLGRPSPVALADYRARLGPDEILIAPVSLPGRTVTLAVTREGLSWASSAATRSHTAGLVARIRKSIDASRDDPSARFDIAAARELYTVVVPAALEPLVRGHRHLLYYASGPLATLPPALLVAAPARRGARTRWLIRSHSISIVPALAAAPVPGAKARDTFLGVGAPSGGTASTPKVPADRAIATAALPPLPGARQELRAMAASFAAGKQHLLFGREATETAVRALPLKSYGVIAFATHGLLSDGLPGLTEPALVLTPGPTSASADDGLLTASEIANLQLDADWVILSACDTASGSDAQGTSYSGLTRAFIEAGARAMLVSHWPVRDDAARRLTVATLREARNGLDRPAALQRAMIALMDDPKVPGSANPAIWAPFVLVQE